MNCYQRKSCRRPTHWALVASLLCAGVLAQDDPTPTPVRPISPWGAEWFPNVPLVTHEGKSVRFFDDLIKDKAVVINFIYTSCPDACPLETAKLREVQTILGDRVGKDTFFYSITIDPARDTPEMLKEYAKKYQAGPGWLFLTGKESDIILLRKKLGLYIDEIQDQSSDHNLSLVIGNQAMGRWKKSSPFDNSYYLADQIGGWLHNYKMAPADRNYADAPKLRNISKGESLFRTRCAVCHIIGREDGVVRPGPNLLGVTQRREPEWLARWLAEPDKMLAEKDPIAMELFGAFNGLPMPNMQLGPKDVEALMRYLDTESRRVAQATPSGMSSPSNGKVPDKCCLKKTEGLDVTENPTVAGNDAPARRGTSWTIALISIGLGLALGLLNFVLGRRRI